VTDRPDEAGGTLGFDRRRVLGGVGALGGLGLLTALSEAGGESTKAQRTPDQPDVDSVRWVAREQKNLALSADGTRFDPGEGVDTAPDVEGFELAASLTTHSSLEYLNVEWDDVGNPNPGSDVDGAWKHTFMLHSYCLGLRPASGAPHLDSTDWVPAKFPDTSREEPDFYTDEVVDYLIENNPGIDQRDDLARSTFDMNVRNELEIATEANHTNVSVSVRRDRNTFGLLQPSAFLESLTGLTGDSDGSGGLTQEEQIATALRVLKNHVRDPGREAAIETTANNAANLAELAEQVQKAEDEQATIELTIGLLLSAAGVIVPIPAAVGFLLSVGFASFDIYDLFNGPEEITPPHRGVFVKLPFNSVPSPDAGEVVEPVAGHYAMIDVYVSPTVSDPVSFSVRSNYPFGGTVTFSREDPQPPNNFARLAEDNKSIWEVAIDPIDGSTPPEETPEEDRYTARLAPLLGGEASIVGPDDTSRRIGVSSSSPQGDIVTFRPTAAFRPTDPEIRDRTNESFLALETGTEVEFDLSSTQLGGAPVESYEFTLDTFDPVDRRPNADPPEDGWSTTEELLTGGSLFSTTGNTTVPYTFDTPGYYGVSLEVQDENGKSHRRRQRVVVEDPADTASPTVDSFTKEESSPEVTFRLDATPVSGSDPDADLTYLWGVAPKDRPLDPDGPPALSPSASSDGSTFRAVPPEPGEYDVWVRIVNVTTGASTLVTGTFTSRAATDVDDDDRLEERLEDVNGDGKADETDVSALRENLDESRIGGNPEAFDFNDDNVVDDEDVEVLFREVRDTEE
jgi:hypothetical protein